MKSRVTLFVVLLAGCAAAVPVAHHAFAGGGHGHGHFGHAAGDHEAIRARIGEALDSFDLPPGTRAQVEEVFRIHTERAMDLLERLHSGQIDHDAATAEHDAIVASAEEALRPYLTPEQIQELRDRLHPQDHGLAMH